MLSKRVRDTDGLLQKLLDEQNALKEKRYMLREQLVFIRERTGDAQAVSRNKLEKLSMAVGDIKEVLEKSVKNDALIRRDLNLLKQKKGKFSDENIIHSGVNLDRLQRKKALARARLPLIQAWRVRSGLRKTRVRTVEARVIDIARLHGPGPRPVARHNADENGISNALPS